MYTQGEKTTTRYVEEEIKDSYINYAMSVIVGRALPDVRDGLKPVQRRILYTMNELALQHNKPYKKSARIIGDTMGRFHPHGDVAIYDALIRMVQDFSLRYPLVDGQGNWGCFTKDTKVKLADGRSLTFGGLIKEAKRGKRNYTYMFNHDTQKIMITEIKNPRLTRKNERIMKVILDNDEEIKCTLDHRFMLRDGSYKEAKDLKPGSSLMPFYTKVFTSEDNPSLELAKKHNHKVVAARTLLEPEDVYDLTTEPYHNFLLDAGVFVHNSIDGDPAAAMRYCVAGDTLIVTEKGLQKIEEIPHHSKVSFSVLSADNKINHVSKWFDSGIHPTAKVTTYRGFSLAGSLNHPILTWQSINDKPAFKWKLLQDISEGDFVVISRCTALFPKKEPDLTRYFPEIKNPRTKRHILPKAMSPTLAFLMGAIVSEGYVSKEHIGFCNTVQEFLKKFKLVFKSTFPDCRLHEFESGPLGYGKQKFVSLQIHSKYVCRFLKNLGLAQLSSKNKTIPEIIFSSSETSISSFLRGYAEGDGSVYLSGAPEIALVSASGNLLKEIQILLLRFGIDSSYRYQPSRRVYKLFIRGHKNLNIFKNKINFLSEKKKTKLAELAKMNSDHWVMSKTDFIPYISEYIRNKDKYRRHERWLNRYNLDRYEKIAKHWEGLKSILDKKDIHLFTTLRKCNYIFDRVITVEAPGLKRVYSIKVDSHCHSFVSNGFISHNSEARLASIADELLGDIDKETVDFVPNFDESLKEPTVLPSALPTLLVNGCSGIAVGMATNMPAHNLNEIADGITRVIDDPTVEIKDLMKIVKGPDFPTGATICGKEGIRKAYTIGRGIVKIHARAQIEKKKGGKESIVVTEIPYQANKTNLIESIAKLVTDKKIEGISDIRDESDKEGIRVVVELKRDRPAQVILNQLYKHTQLSSTFGVIMLALVNNQPRVLNLRQLFDLYIEHRKEIVTRRTRFLLRKAQERAHILEGLKIALKYIDRIVKTIRHSKDAKIAKQALIKNFDLSERQAQAILEMQLQRLTALERSKIEAEYLELIKKIELYESILASETRILEIIKKELAELKKKYGDERRTDIVAEVEELKIEDLIAEEDVVITISHSGYIKRLPVSAYRRQKRGGRGVVGAELREEDFIEHLFIATTHEYILFFSNKGRVYWLKVHEIPQAGRVSKGKAIVNLLQLSSGESISAFVRVKEFDKGGHLVMATQNGLVKKTELAAYSNPRKGGIVGITIEKEDNLIGTALTDGNQEIILATREGKAIRFKEKDVRDMGRGAKGVRAIKLGKKDKVIGMVVARPEATLLTVSEKGFGKRTPIDEYRLQSRGGKGIINVKATSKSGLAVGIKMVTGKDEVMIITESGIIVRTPVKGIRATGRSTQGVKVITLKDPKDKVSAVASVVAEEK